MSPTIFSLLNISLCLTTKHFFRHNYTKGILRSISFWQDDVTERQHISLVCSYMVNKWHAENQSSSSRGQQNWAKNSEIRYITVSVTQWRPHTSAFSWSKKEVPRDVRNSKDPKTWQVQEWMVSPLEQMQDPCGTGPGIQRSKRLVFACRTRCKYPMETSRNKVITPKTAIRSTLVTMSRLSEMSDQWRVSLYMMMSQNVM